MLWTWLPNLRQLHWTIATTGIVLSHETDAFGLPPNLQHLHLAIHWDVAHQEATHDLELFHLAEGGLHWHEKLSSLRIIPPDGQFLLDSPMTMHLGQDSASSHFPNLTRLRIVTDTITGRLHAPNLTSIAVQVEDNLSWKAFDTCRYLRKIWIRCADSESVLDCTGSTFPDTLRLLCLDVGILKEDGCLNPRSAVIRHGTMKLAFHALDSSVSLLAPIDNQPGRDVFVMPNGRVEVYSPPRCQVDWPSILTSWVNGSEI